MAERRANRRRDAEAVHHRLRAVLAGPDGDAFAVEDRADVVRVHAVDHERQDAGLAARLADHAHAGTSRSRSVA